MLLILTVGTGTTGPFSNVQQGIVNTIDQSGPRRFWLVPSASESSLTGADLIREAVSQPGAFMPFSDQAPYALIRNPDNLEDCRDTVDQVLAKARAVALPDEALVVNPTSGTKQMSVGATLAALQNRAHRLDFITGQRDQGIVITGQERINSLDTGKFLSEQAISEARALLRSGAFSGAALILQQWEDRSTPARLLYHSARCLTAWQRLHYQQARQIAADNSVPTLQPLRQPLTALAQAPELSPLVIHDVLDSAACLLQWEYPEEALARLYRAAELLAKTILSQQHGLQPPYALDDLLHLIPKQANRFRALARDGQVHIGQHQAWDLLDFMEDPTAQLYNSSRKLRRALESRNRTLFGHGIATVDATDVETTLCQLKELTQTAFPPTIPPLSRLKFIQAVTRSD